jgi:hypothetical protein
VAPLEELEALLYAVYYEYRDSWTRNRIFTTDQ